MADEGAVSPAWVADQARSRPCSIASPQLTSSQVVFLTASFALGVLFVVQVRERRSGGGSLPAPAELLLVAVAPKHSRTTARTLCRARAQLLLARRIRAYHAYQVAIERCARAGGCGANRLTSHDPAAVCASSAPLRPSTAPFVFPSPQCRPSGATCSPCRPLTLHAQVATHGIAPSPRLSIVVLSRARAVRRVRARASNPSRAANVAARACARPVPTPPPPERVQRPQRLPQNVRATRRAPRAFIRRLRRRPPVITDGPSTRVRGLAMVCLEMIRGIDPYGVLGASHCPGRSAPP
jgi:hypothetical protein